MAKIDILFDDMMKRGGSDLHIAAGYPPLARIRGELAPVRDGELTGAEVEELLYELISSPQKGRLQTEQVLDFAFAHRDIARFRASYFLKTTGVGAVFRLVPGRVLTLAELGCPEALWRLADRRSGLVLVTGPTGSGRSTTLAALVDHINKTRACHIVTIEDPIEFVHEPLRAHVTHREIGVHAPTFSAAMKAVTRESPDVVLVSELRTNEALESALQLASYGILVFAAVSSLSAVATVERTINVFPESDQPRIRGALAESLAGIVGQQLVRTADGKGRVAVHEILVGGAQVSALIREGKTAQLAGVMQTGQTQGMQTMDMALERLLMVNRISPEAALERATDREAFAQVVARVRPDLAETLG